MSITIRRAGHDVQPYGRYRVQGQALYEARVAGCWPLSEVAMLVGLTVEEMDAMECGYTSVPDEVRFKLLRVYRRSRSRMSLNRS